MRYFGLLIIIVFLLSCSSENSNSGINPLPNFDAMWDYTYPDSTEMRFKEILPLLTQTSEFSISDAYHAELLTQIARAQGLQGKFTEAAANLLKADSLITDDMPIARIRFLLERGRLLNTIGQRQDATDLFLKAYNFGIENKLDYQALDAAHMLGITTPADEQLQWSLKALEIAETSEDLRCKNWLGALYNNIGWTYFDKDDYLQAHKLFVKGYEWRKEQGEEQAARIARWAVARSLRALFRFQEALHIQLSLENEIAEKNLPPDGYVYEELAELYLATQNHQKAREYFQKAYEVLSEDEWIAENEPDRLNYLKQMSKL